MTFGAISYVTLAAGPSLPELAQSARTGPDSTAMIAIVLMAVLSVVLIIVLWAVFVRRPAGAAERGRLVSATTTATSEGRSSNGKRRRRRKDHRGRNPTLSETGGLPQPNAAEQPPTTP